MIQTPFDYRQWMAEEEEKCRALREQQQQEEALRAQRRALFARLRQEQQNSDQLFLETSGQITFAEGVKVTSRILYEHYTAWCLGRGYAPKSRKELSSYLCRNADRYHIRYSTNIPTEEGRRLRGFLGMGLSEDTDTPASTPEGHNTRV